MQLVTYKLREGVSTYMGKPKKRTSPRATGARRSHLLLKLARTVNKKSPVKVFTTAKQSGKKFAATK